jgi:hypothetical protein
VIKHISAIIINNTNFSAFNNYLINANKALSNKSIVLNIDFVFSLFNYLAQLTSNSNNIYSLVDKATLYTIPT